MCVCDKAGTTHKKRSLLYASIHPFWVPYLRTSFRLPHPSLTHSPERICRGAGAHKASAALAAPSPASSGKGWWQIGEITILDPMSKLVSTSLPFAFCGVCIVSRPKFGNKKIKCKESNTKGEKEADCRAGNLSKKVMHF